MDLSDALGDWPNQPGQPSGPPNWPGQPSWPGGQPGGNGQWPGGPGGNHPAWPGGPGGNSQWPGGQPGGNSQWPGGPGGNSPWPGGQPGGTFPTQPGQPSNPGPLTVPYNLSLPNGIYDKLLITIKGAIKSHPDKFTVDVSAGRDIAFHFNPRFNESGRKVIVCNTLVNNSWGKEERDCRNFPFIPGQQFELKILCTTGGFKVAVNGTHLLEYKHRLHNLRSIKQVSVYNDVTLSSVQTDKLP